MPERQVTIAQMRPMRIAQTDPYVMMALRILLAACDDMARPARRVQVRAECDAGYLDLYLEMVSLDARALFLAHLQLAEHDPHTYWRRRRAAKRAFQEVLQ